MAKRVLLIFSAVLFLALPPLITQASDCSSALSVSNKTVLLFNDLKQRLQAEHARVNATGFSFTKEEHAFLMEVSGSGLVPEYTPQELLLRWYNNRIGGLSDVIEFEIRKTVAEALFEPIADAVAGLGIESFQARMWLVKLQSAIDASKLSQEQLLSYLQYAQMSTAENSATHTVALEQTYQTLASLFPNQKKLDKLLKKEAAPGLCCGSGCQTCRYFPDERQVAHNQEYFAGKLLQIKRKPKQDASKYPMPDTLELFNVRRALSGALSYIDP